MNRMTRVLLPAAALLLGTGTALAYPHGGSRADTDGDGAVSKEEMRQMRVQMFDRMDADGDGYVTDEEMDTHRKKMEGRHEKMRERMREKRDAWLDELDDDDDGRVSRDEMADAPFPFFEKADADGDGKLTRDEMKAMRGKHHGMDKP